MNDERELLRTVGLTRHFRLGGMLGKAQVLHAVDDFNLTIRCRQRSIFGRVGRELMQGDRNGLGRTWFQHNGWTVNSHARLFLPAVSQKLLGDQTMKLGSRPAGFHEQRMYLCERVNAPFD